MSDSTPDTFDSDAEFDPRRFATLLTTAWLACLMVVLPVKLGMNLTSVSEMGMFPADQAEWILGLWPSWLVPALVGATLLATLLYAPPPPWVVWRRTLHLWLPWALLLIAALPGLAVTTEVDEARLFWVHLLSVVGLIAAVMLHLRAWPRARYVILGAACLGGVLVALYGWYQRLWGLELMRESFEALQKENGQAASEQYRVRLESNRIFGTFAGANSLGAHLALLFPLAIAGPLLITRWQLTDAHPDDRTRQMVLGGILTAMLSAVIGVALLWTGSRGGQLATIVAIGLIGVVSFAAYYRASGGSKQLLKRGLIVAAVGTVVLGSVAVVGIKLRGESLGKTVEYRLEYWHAGAQMFRSQPLTGVGIGEYQNWHLRLKPIEMVNEDARLPHNVVVFFASQSGVAGLLASLYLLAMPAILMLQFLRGRLPVADSIWLVIPVLGGVMAWLLHALVDFNIVIPGTVVTAAILPLCLVDVAALAGEAEPPRPPLVWAQRLGFAALGVVLVAVVWQRIPGEQRYLQLTHDIRKPVPVASNVKGVAETAALLPHNPNAWSMLAQKAVYQRQAALAVDALDRAIALTPHRAKYHALQAEAYMGLGDHERAKAAIDRALLWYPTKPRYQELRDIIYRIAAETPDATPSPTPRQPPATPEVVPLEATP